MLLRDNVDRMVRRMKGETTPDWRWALRDISLHIEPGEAVGLIGANGSGKSTLLKILTRVMVPYAGALQVRGRVGALIEVRAGIHPDLTGRENAFLYGSLLGLPRREVAKRFDAIVDFAELDDAIDRQVKFYSSGMQMRLGFAVAAFLEPEVLLVDEVLAVGDALFQQKCLDRMRAVLQQGTTLVFVSHDLSAVESISSRGLWLDQGVIRVDGTISQALEAYRGSIEQRSESEFASSGPVRLLKADVRGVGRTSIATNSGMKVDVTYDSDKTDLLAHLHLGITEGTANPIFSLRKEIMLKPGEASLTCEVPRTPLPRGRYVLWVGMFSWDGSPLLTWQPVTQFDVHGPDLDPAPRAVVRMAPFFVEHSWT
jgi:ABC-2 type transport system ATP-binding protein